MATIPAPGPDAQARVNHVGRMFGVLFSPKATFEDIGSRPSWIAPIVFLTIISLGVSTLMAQKVNWERVVSQSMDQNPRTAQMTPEQRQQSLATGTKIAGISVYVVGVIGNLVAALLLAGVFLGAFNLLAGAGVGFGTATAIASHALMPLAISGVLGIVILSVKDPDTIDPQHLIAANLGALLGSDAPKWLERLAASVDVFWIWILLLLATGFAAASPKKVSMGKAVGIVFGLYVAFRLVLVSLAAI